jgi:hypothetical protein
MRRITRTLAVAALALAGMALIGDRPARAQNNTYADWPYNQGSLFYRYRPYRPSAARPQPAAPVYQTRPAAPVYQTQRRRFFAPARSYYVWPRNGVRYVYPRAH